MEKKKLDSPEYTIDSNDILEEINTEMLKRPAGRAMAHLFEILSRSNVLWEKERGILLKNHPRPQDKILYDAYLSEYETIILVWTCLNKAPRLSAGRSAMSSPKSESSPSFIDNNESDLDSALEEGEYDMDDTLEDEPRTSSPHESQQECIQKFFHICATAQGIFKAIAKPGTKKNSAAEEHLPSESQEALSTLRNELILLAHHHLHPASTPKPKISARAR